ncbi:MAG: polysaccharide pyruvyl transferase family protein [Bacteroidia bacterium]|nr:polysaccharide pyruvyl transferase family protein [Bacteroidia bacterium]NND11753.1 polysaccharide pyruvyl transferase family protein [Flavobacteriaceae bacterium]NNK27367.1 polysaccharide pyruvyl transferase family protein [Flavobacteriaceae bacterium]
MNSSRNINLFWWSSVKFEGKSQENFGDILSRYLVEKISGKQVVWKNPMKRRWNPFRKKIYTTTGSILKHVSKDCIVWGSGIISRNDEVQEAEFLAVRGPETYKFLKEKGYDVNEVFGDPAILLPGFYKPKGKKEISLGIIPHYVDYNVVNEWYSDNKNIEVIDLLNDDVESVIEQISKCKEVISSSLHGLIVSHTYGIPAVWIQFSQKLSGDNIKFADYFKSVKLKPYNPEFIDKVKNEEELHELITKYPSLPKEIDIDDLRIGLMKVCPFKQ